MSVAGRCVVVIVNNMKTKHSIARSWEFQLTDHFPLNKSQGQSGLATTFTPRNFDSGL